MIAKGIVFWTDKKTTKLSTDERVKYLESKGLTEAEIIIVKREAENIIYKAKIEGLMVEPDNDYKKIEEVHTDKEKHHRKHKHRHKHKRKHHHDKVDHKKHHQKEEHEDAEKNPEKEGK